jgi:glycosyltransferase involved in cell wall biosynthesis
VVATDVGGIRAAVGDAVTLIPPADAGAAIEALERIASDAELRRRQTERGAALVGAATIQVEVERVAEFIEGRVG